MGDHPYLCAEKEHQLDHGFKEKSGHQRRRPLPAENPHQPLPHTLCLCQVFNYRRPIIVCCWDHPPQVFERVSHLKGASICAEIPGCDRPLLFHCEAPHISLLPLLALRGAPMHTIKRPPRNQNVSQRAPWVGKFALLHYHHGVPDMPVPEIHPRGRMRRHTATRRLKWEGPWSWPCRERHPKSPGIFAPASLVVLLPHPHSRHAVLGLVVCIQWTPC